jgi:hypothetical protein
MALSRVHGGAVARYRGEYLDGGAPMPRYLIPELLFDALAAWAAHAGPAGSARAGDGLAD